MHILSIDPGDMESAYTVIDVQTFQTLEKGKIFNRDLLFRLPEISKEYEIKFVAIEMIKSYGMGVGDHVFETCVWIGRFIEKSIGNGCTVERITRMEEKMHICKDSKANDRSIRRALIDRFAKHDKKSGKGNAKKPDVFYGFSEDIWSAFATGLTFIETKLNDLL